MFIGIKMVKTFPQCNVPSIFWIVNYLLKICKNKYIQNNMEILYSKVGTTKLCMYIFMESKFNDALVVLHDGKYLSKCWTFVFLKWDC